MSESTKNKIFWWIFSVSILASVFATYLRVFVYENYFLVKEVACDTETGSCFERTPEMACADLETQEETDACLNETTETEYYKIIHIKAYAVPDCTDADMNEEGNCPDLVCAEGASDEECFYEFNTDQNE